MDLLLSCHKVGKTFGATPLFTDLSLGVYQRDRVGLIGANGAGKSTLLKMMAREMEPDTGRVTIKTNTKTNYVPQTPQFPPLQTVLAATMEAAQKAGVPESDLLVEASIALGQLGFMDWDQQVGALSGGWKKRLAIGCGTLGDPDLVLFDEPTNHLDWEGLLWLEGFLQKAPFAWVAISHDRYLLTQTVQRIIEIDSRLEDGCLETDGAYDAHVEKKVALLSGLQERQERLENTFKIEQEWARRGPKARGTKAKFRMDGVEEKKEQLADLRRRNQTQSLGIEFLSSGRKTKTWIELKHVGLSRGNQNLIENLNFTLASKMIVGILGANGVGKSSLLQLLTGAQLPTQGDIKRAENLRVLYMEQERESLPLTATLRSALAEHGDQVVVQGQSIHVVTWAKRFGFASHQLDTLVHKLSGGEQARLLLARLLTHEADVLLLDEPTNDLDIATLEELERCLELFSGTVVLVTHDRYLMRRLCTHFLGFTQKGMLAPFASLEQWLKEFTTSSGASEKKKNSPLPTNAPAEASSKKKRSFKEQREWDTMEARIAEAEAELATLDLQLQQPNLTPEALQKLCSTREAKTTEIEEFYKRWGELE